MILTNIHNQVIDNSTKAYLCKKVIIVHVARFIGMPNVYFLFYFMCHFY